MAIGFAAVLFFPSKSTEQSKTQITSLCPTDVELTDAVVSSSLNLSPEQISAVKAARALSNNDLCTMPKAKLDRAMYRTDHPKADKPGEWAKFRAMQQTDESGTVKPNGLAEAVAQRHAMLAANTAARAAGQVMPMAGITQSAWTPIGPGNIGGRTRTIAPHPTDPNKLWLGSVGGGIWKTTDGGASWSAVNDFMGNIAVSALAISPDGNTLYAGTGEGFFNGDALRGAGIFKSTDGGTTWNQLPNASPTASTDWYYVNRIAIQPGTPATVLAATNSGLYKSTDSGATWSKRYTGRVTDIKFNPANGALAILGTGYGSGTIAYSADAGSTWTNSPSFTAKGNRVELAYGSGNTAYAAYDHASSGSGQIWKSTDAGATWALISTPGHLGNQGWYDNTIWVDPTNNNHLIVGGLDLYRSTNGGVTWTKISQWYSVNSGSVHADHHTIVSAAGYNGTSNKTIYFGNDGGIYKAADITAVTSVTTGWTKLNNGLAITQFYSGAGHNGTNGHVIGGAQDNGSLLYAGSGSNWSEYYGGDGGYSDVDPTDGNYLYGEYVYLQMHRSTDGGASSASSIYSGISDAGSNANFIAPFALDLNNSNTMLAGGASLWRSTNVKAATPTWTAIKVSTGSYISAITTAQGTGGSDKIWVGHNNGALYKTANGTATTPSWTQSGTGVLPSRMLLSILVDKDDHNKVYATFGGYSSGNIWRTTDGGTTWTDISTNLPQAPIRSVQRHPNRANYLYVGTEVGVFTSEDGGTTWNTTNDGPANVSVDKLFWLDATTLVAATHGRGMFKVSVPLDQTITFNAFGNKTLGDPDFTLSATANSSLPVSFSSQTPAVCTVTGNTVHLVAAGNCTIRANQAGNSSYNAAPFVDQGITVSAAANPSGSTGGGGGGGAFGWFDAAVGLLLGLVAWVGMRRKAS